jgi:hypothetical protein
MLARSVRRPSTLSELLTSDPAIVAFSAFGLVATVISIVRDARAQRVRALVEELPVLDEHEDLAA